MACESARSRPSCGDFSLTFQPGKSKGLDAVYHFSFTGKEPQQATVTIRDGKLDGRGRASRQVPTCT